MGEIYYWEKAGPENTDATVELALKRARALHISHVVVASNTGDTARRFLNQGLEVVCVTHQIGVKEPGGDEMDPGVRKELQEQGVAVLTTTHLLSGIGRALTQKFGGLDPVQVIAITLRLFGQGTKVCLEIASMALDAGLIPHGQEVMVVGGSGRGADTALVVTPEHSRAFFDGWVHEILCKPR